jgi:hypothetical protein
MDETNYTVAEVVEALQTVGLSEEIVEYIVPILAYESRPIGGEPFTLSAKDPISESWGIGQTNVTSMQPAIWMALQEVGVDIPQSTKLQKKQWKSAKVVGDEKDVRAFTDAQKDFVVNYLLEKADLKFSAYLVKHMINQKKIESSKISTDIEAVNDLYKLTVAKFNQPKKHPEAAEFKQSIEKEMKEGVPSTTTTTVLEQEPDRGIPEPSETFVPDSLPVTRRTPQVNSEYYTQVPLAAQNPSYARVKQMLEAQVNKQKKSAGHTPYIPGVVPQVTFSDAVQAALKLLGR